MNIILLTQQDFIGKNCAKVSGRRQEHIVSILKLNIGDELKVGMLDGKLGVGRIADLADDGITLDVCLIKNPLKKISMTVILALSRPPVFRRVLSALTAMGVAKIICIQTARVEKSYWSSPVLRDENIKKAMMLGLEQSCDTILPEISFEKRFKPFVEDRLPEMIKGEDCFLAHPEKASACPSNISKPCILAVGPEGGFVDYEVQKFCGLGFKAVYLGERILRVETAVQALVGRLMPI